MRACVWRVLLVCVRWAFMCMYDMSRSYVWHDSFICMTCPVHMCDMSHSYVRHDLFICVQWAFICVCDVCVCAFMCAWRRMCACLRRASLVRVRWAFIHMCAMYRSYVWHDLLICVQWAFICMCVYMCVCVCVCVCAFMCAWHRMRACL